MILAIATGPLYERLTLRHPRLREGLLLPSLFTALFALAVLIPLGLALIEGARERADAVQWIASARACTRIGGIFDRFRLIPT